VLIEATSEQYKELFGNYPFNVQFFQSAAMPYEAMVACLSDPSICAKDEQNEGALLDGPLQNSLGARDFRLGTQYMLHSVLTYTASIQGPEKIETNGILSSYGDAATLVMKNFVLSPRMDDEALRQALMDAAFGGGMQALGAIGPVGKVIAAVIGFAVAIAQTVKARKPAEKRGLEAMRRAVFARMPPMQQPSTFTDDFLIRDRLLPMLQAGDWTDIFSPRFESDTGQWVGIKRRYGYAFAPGRKTGGKDEVGEDADVFDPGPGLGIIPGMDQMTSVIQVSLDFESPAVKVWQSDKTRHWPVEAQHVVDVGQFYVNTGRLGSVAWAWATQQEQSLDLFKLYVGKPGGPGKNHLHARWKKYCDGGIEFLHDNAAAWIDADSTRFDDLRYMYGASIACAVGAWRCYVKGGTTYVPEYGQLLPGNPRFEMGHFDGLQPTYGCVLHPNLVRAVADGKACLASMYDTHIRPTLEAVRARQEHYLGASLLCAYVRASWGAFRDAEMLDRLNKMRAKLLEHPDRKLVDLDDVPAGERFNGGDWKDQLRKAGVTSKPGGIGIKGLGQRPGTIEPGGKPAPKVPEDPGPMPFASLAPKRCGRDCQDERRAWKLAGIVGGAGLLTAAGFGIQRWRKLRQGKAAAS
jgi:hypothetical protein